MDASAASLPSSWRSGLRSARAHLWPGLALQAVALALVLSYYYSAPGREALGELVVRRREAGFAFGMISTALVGGVMPFLYLRFFVRHRSAEEAAAYTWKAGFGLTAFWCYKGLEIDAFYRVEAHFIGSGHGAATILAKTVTDQFVYCPAFAVPATVAFYLWMHAGFDRAAFFADWRAPGWYARRVLPVLVSNLGVWVPAVAIIYALPTPLQLPLQNLVLCFFNLLLAHQTRDETVPLG